jgi:hypothetical protein
VTTRIIGVGLLALAVALPVVGWCVEHATPAQTSSEWKKANGIWQDESAVYTPPLRAMDGLTLEKVNWHMGGFGNIPIADFTVKSTNEWTSKDIEFTCTTKGASGTDLSALRATVYDSIPAKTTKILKGVNMGLANSQSATMWCSISAAKP